MKRPTCFLPWAKAAFAAALLLLAGCGEASRSIGKKGISCWNDDAKFNHLSTSMEGLQCGWYYNWTPRPDRNSPNLSAQFVPMIWNGADASPEILAGLKKAGYKTLLGFNEPDGKEQANMTVEEAIELWPRLMKTGMRLGSPAPASGLAPDGWLERFMEEAQKRNYRVDFICLHWYGDVTDPEAVTKLRDFVNHYWEKYHKPIWLTEFSGSNGYWLNLKNPPVTEEKNAEFIRKAVPMLESLPYLERYAWFELKWKKAPWEEVALVDPANGKLTSAGIAWRDSGPNHQAKVRSINQRFTAWKEKFFRHKTEASTETATLSKGTPSDSTLPE